VLITASGHLFVALAAAKVTRLRSVLSAVINANAKTVVRLDICSQTASTAQLRQYLRSL
jgi:hypothetical protein